MTIHDTTATYKISKFSGKKMDRESNLMHVKMRVTFGDLHHKYKEQRTSMTLYQTFGGLWFKPGDISNLRHLSVQLIQDTSFTKKFNMH